LGYAVGLKVVLGIAALLALSACGRPGKSVQPVVADSALTRAARYFEPPPPDRARVIIVSGQTMRYTGTAGTTLACTTRPATSM
jgi:hypothetical protein